LQNQAKGSINKFEIEHKGEDCMVCAVLKAAFVGVGTPNNEPAEQKQRNARYQVKEMLKRSC
jgi:hypothetical protein